MNLLFFVATLLRLSFATAVNFTQVFEWPDGLDYEWPSVANRTQALKDGTFEPEKIEPNFMAVFGTRIFHSLHKDESIPATLVSLPTSRTSSASPKLTPFPSWDMQEYGNCDKIEQAAGLEVDAIGRLWVLDDGSENCNSKLWIFDLSNNDQIKLIYNFPFRYNLHDLVLDETPDGYFAYITRWGEQDIVVFSLEREESWIVKTPGMKVFSIALSPKEEPRQLYLSNLESNELLSISVDILRDGIRTANPKLIRKWTALHSYRMLMDDHGTLYSAFLWDNSILSWDTYQRHQERHFYEVGKLDTDLPFTFALDSSGTFWITEINKTATRPSYRLLKAAVGAKPYINEPSKTGGNFAANGQTDNPVLIGLLAFLLVFSCTSITLWLSMRMRMRKLQNSNEQRNAGVVQMEMHPV